ncbi:coat F domain-containing protein [Tumebacillus sp. BK434]|uniref:spore coat protein n=1 Tax=Tumebacillus sp. BK434 TaxID=2512169 RepID=UPI0010D534CF|nr:spore coat protein [Tumebacillus sp. BK434]TCP55365.1 coat F domain-containing protein [Tumebacillus sp. BK434]
MQHLPTNSQEHIMMAQQKGNLPRVKGPEMNDRDRLNDVLATEKYITQGYNTSLNEFSHRELYDTVKRLLNNTHDAQRAAFEQMFNLGWYKLPQQPLDTVALAYNQFSNYKGQFPYQQ